VQKQHYDGFAERQDRLDEIVLTAEEIEAVAVTGMIDGPRLAGSLFILAEHENDYIGLLGNANSLLNAFRI